MNIGFTFLCEALKDYVIYDHGRNFSHRVPGKIKIMVQKFASYKYYVLKSFLFLFHFSCKKTKPCFIFFFCNLLVLNEP